jgi:hypothetical protein
MAGTSQPTSERSPASHRIPYSPPRREATHSRTRLRITSLGEYHRADHVADAVIGTCTRASKNLHAHRIRP